MEMVCLDAHDILAKVPKRSRSNGDVERLLCRKRFSTDKSYSYFTMIASFEAGMYP